MGDRRKDFDDVSTIHSPLRGLPNIEIPAFVITIFHGPDQGYQGRIDGTNPRIHLGKSPTCELRLSDPMVSRRHLTLDVVDEHVRLVDLGSTNGSFVNGVLARDVLLRGGETVVLGETHLRVDRAAPSPGAASSATGFGRLIGSSPEMRRIYPLLEKLAAAEVPIVIEGETGTGKEVVAESLHEAGPRAAQEFVVFDCTAVAPSLMESALFGHERGAFTGATNTQKGVFEQAHGGTLLIDEIGELDPSLQPKLLRAIERSEVRRVGGDRWIKVDVRVMCATRRDLENEIQAGRFRDDLFYRLAVARVELPALRDRRGDVAVLSQHFWRRLGGTGPIPYDVLLRFESYGWPGNVRELRNAVARKLALGDLALGPSSRRDVPAPEPTPEGIEFIDRIVAMDLPLSQSRDLVVEEFERRYIDHSLVKTEGDATKAAISSGVARRYFQLLRAKRGR